MTTRTLHHQRREAGRIGGLVTSARHDTSQSAAKARAAFAAQLHAEVDPEGVLDANEAERRVKALRKALAVKAAAKSAEVRARRAGKVRCSGCGRWHKATL